MSKKHFVALAAALKAARYNKRMNDLLLRGGN